MCGIAGFVGDGSREKLERMVAAIAHRGPDDMGVLIRDNVGLGHRRLAILDTSARGHQPMSLDHEDVSIVFNGEIYNFRELREGLEKQGRTFASDSDTEVLLQLYAVHSDKFLDEVRGMFAMALYDFKRKKLVLARDRMGEKPLYWHYDNNTFRFGSELRALLATSMHREIDPVSLQQYLQFDYVPTPRTIFKDVYKLEPGTTLVFEKGNITKRPFWKPNIRQLSLSEGAAVQRLDTLLAESVSRQLVSDVPLGVFLSGGLDSSTVAYYAARASTQRIHTFSIGFDDSSFDESGFAREAARHIGTEHHELVMKERDALELINEIPEVFSEPVADASVIPTMFLSRFARQSVAVALGGDGGDELFAGYPTFQAESLFRYYKHTPIFLRSLMERGVGQLPASHRNFSLTYNLSKFVGASNASSLERHLMWLGTFGEKARIGLVGNPLDVFGEARRYAGQYIGDQGNQLLYMYMRTYLMDQVLVKVDRASMRFALETRAPFLDHALVEYLLSLPYSYKYRWGSTKRLLKKTMRHKLPDSIIDRKKKGFGVPLARWLVGPLKPLCDELLSERSMEHGLFNMHYIGQLKQEHFAHKRDNRKELWNLMVFQMWHKRWME